MSTSSEQHIPADGGVIKRCPITGQVGICPAMQHKNNNTTPHNLPTSTNAHNSMYLLDEYKETSVEKLLPLIDSTTYGTIITASEQHQLMANIFPFTLHEVERSTVHRDGIDVPTAPYKQTVLRCHYPRSSVAQLDVLRQYANERKSALLTFTPSSAAYISSQWYPTKKTNPTLVPTYDFSTIHCHAVPTLINDENIESGDDVLFDHLGVLTEKTEGRVKQQDPTHKKWSLSDAPRAAMNHKMRNLVCIEFVLHDVVAKFKLNQDTPKDIDGVVAGLRRVGDDNMAELVRSGGIAGCLVPSRTMPNGAATATTTTPQNGDYQKLVDHNKWLYVIIIFLIAFIVGGML